jgi:hypothetical protein
MNVLSLKRTSNISVTACLFCVFIFPTEALSMSFLNIFGLRLCAFSAVEGKVTKEGKPIPNALVKRSYKWDGENITDEVTTDEDGSFSFSNQYQNSLFAIFPHNPSVSQRIKIYFGENEYLAWAYQKGNYDVNGELNGKALIMYCDLNNPQEKHSLENYKIYSGICGLK